MRFVSHSEAAEYICGKAVAIVGSAPSCAQNEPGFVDSHDVVVRANNYKVGAGQGRRCDVFYSFFGGSIRKRVEDLKRDGVTLCMCKCPDAHAISSPWHERRGKVSGVDFRYIYRSRANWWFCDTYVPSVSAFLANYELLERHVPTTGFAAILDVLSMEPASVYLTGFDGFSSGLHNVDEPWRAGDPGDPVGHQPQKELDWLAGPGLLRPLTFDARLQQIVNERRRVAA